MPAQRLSLVDIYLPVLSMTGSGFVDCGSVHAYERTQAFSIGAWIRSSGTGGAIRTICGTAGSSTSYRGYALRLQTTGVVALVLANTEGSNWLAVAGTTVVTDGQWHYVEATYDGSSTPGGIAIYVDGVRESTSTVANTLTATILPSGPFRIGAAGDGTRGWTGEIGEVRVFTAVRTEADIRASQLLVPVSTSALDGLWRLSEGRGTTTANKKTGATGTITGATWQLFSRPVYRWADAFHEQYAAYAPYLAGHLSIRSALPGTQGEPGDETASCAILDASLQRSGIQPRFIDIVRNDDDFIGAPARGQCIDPSNGSVIAQVFGAVSDVTVEATGGSFTIRSPEDEVRQLPVPRITVLDRYPSAWVEGTSGGERCEIVPFGRMRKAELTLCLTALLRCQYSFPNTLANNFRYDILSSVTSYVVQTGDILYYDVWWPSGTNQRIALDLETSDGLALRSAGATDQHGLNAHPDTDLSGRMRLGWYRRRIPLPTAWVGKTIVRFLVACEADSAGSYEGYIHNAFIGDDTGVIRKHIVTDAFQSMSTTLHTRADTGNTATYTFTRQYYYGPIKPARQGQTTTVTAVYRDGQVVPTSEYSVVQLLSLFVRFDREQRDGSGRPFRIQADLSTTDFDRNPARVIEWLLSDDTYGAGEPIDSGAMTTAATVYNTLSYVCGGGLERQMQLGDVLRLLSLRGGRFARNTSGAYRYIVDRIEEHPNAGRALGAGDGVYENVSIESVQYAPLPSAMRPTAFELRAAFDPGFGGEGEYLLRARRQRSGMGLDLVEESPFLFDPTAVDREAEYRLRRLSLQSYSLSLLCTSETAQIALGEVVTVTIPSRMISGQHMVVSREIRGLAVVLGCVPWDAAVFSYTAGDVRVARGFHDPVDYRMTFPATPTGFSASTPVTAVLTNGAAISYVGVSATAPPANVTELVFRASRVGNASIEVESRVKVTPGQSVSGVAIALSPGVSYDLECYAFNGFNLAGFQYSAPSLLTNITAPPDNEAPTNTPVATGESIRANPDASIDVTLNWSYTQGARPADRIIVFWNHSDSGPPPALSVTDRGVHLRVVNTYTFHGLDPTRRYRFGVAAARAVRATGGLAVTAIVDRTQWHDITGQANFTGTIAGTPAVTVVSNASDGKTAFDQTVRYRTAGAPSNTPAPSGLSVGPGMNADGSIDYTLFWNYTQGTRQADGFLVFVKDGDTSSFALSDPHYQVSGYQLSGTFSVSWTLKGAAPERIYSFGVAAFRRTENAIEVGTIVTSTASPDWVGVSSGSPNFIGTIFGLEQHTFRLKTRGITASQTDVGIWRDKTRLSWTHADPHAANFLAGTGVARSYLLAVYNTELKQLEYAHAYDIFGVGTEATEADRLWFHTTGTGDPWGTYSTYWGKFGYGLWYDNQATATRTLTVATQAKSTSYNSIRNIDFWIKIPSGLYGVLMWFSESQLANSGYTAAVCYIDSSGRPRARAYSNSTTFVEAASTASITNDQWRHIAISLTGSQLRLFVDGALVASAATTLTTFTGSAPTAGLFFGIGQAPATGIATSSRWAWTIDEISIWNQLHWVDPFTPLNREYHLSERSSGFCRIWHFAESGLFNEPSREFLIDGFRGGAYPEQTPTSSLSSVLRHYAFVARHVGEARVIFLAGNDEPSTNRLNGKLAYAVALVGGSRTCFAGNFWRFRSAYALISKNDAGEGNGLEMYAGAVNDDPGAYLDLSATLQDHQLVAQTGSGWNPKLIPGPPTNNPTGLSLSNTTTDTGSRRHTLSWSYTQPAPEGNNALADGFILFFQEGSTSDPIQNQIKLGPDVRTYVFDWSLPQGTVVSYAIAAYRVTMSGIEAGPKQTVASWQGQPASAQVTNPGIANISADKITTGLLTVNPSGPGATAIYVTNAGKIRMVTHASNSARIDFENSSGTVVSQIAADVSSPANVLQITATGNVTNSRILLGTSVGGTSDVDVTASYMVKLFAGHSLYSSGTIMFETFGPINGVVRVLTNHFRVTATESGSTGESRFTTNYFVLENLTAIRTNAFQSGTYTTPSSFSRRIRVEDLSGTLLGYIPIF